MNWAVEIFENLHSSINYVSNLQERLISTEGEIFDNICELINIQHFLFQFSQNINKIKSTQEFIHFSEKRNLVECKAAPLISPVTQDKSDEKENLETNNSRFEKQFICNQFPNCANTYRSRENLKLHILNKHLLKKPFECSFCKKVFSHRNGNKKY